MVTSPNEDIFSSVERNTRNKQTTNKQSNKNKQTKKHMALFDMFVEFIHL